MVIGGITGGIGAALARRLSKQDCALYGFARDQEKIDALREELGIDIAKVDAGDPDAVADYLKSVQKSAGRIDAYVHAIGSIFLKPAHLTSPDDWQDVIHANLNTAFYALRACTKVMQSQKHGSCLFFSTAAAQTGIANHEAIAAAKGGIEAMIRAAAATYSSRGLRFNAIAPSLTDTPLAKPVVGSEQGLEISKRMHPLGEIGDPDEVASLAQWLMSEDARFVTGQTFVMDGGISSVVPKPKA
jgi:NAD(P)-dependent dehydrogenase (short-subunit alcohol dehydrogenase family)